MPRDPEILDSNLSEAVLFAILVYVLFLGTSFFVQHIIVHRLVCPFSGWVLHGGRDWCSKCPNCGLEQSPRSVFCCTRKHSVYLRIIH
ncbi:unnamed protein product [Ceutorhynchus assimilis]|uniref:Uncharacterized protein n=1 Tax=Ceutorhynchus assimilis TaxID=467358 RepID=A0A9N9MSM5_9CUCU|nr:unnamed protein product [Ceutorhynchus assimilis]